MSKFDEMSDYLPEYFSRLLEMQEILKTQAPEFEQQNEAIFSITDQLFITSATWGLDRWEGLLNIQRDGSEDIEMRRARLINKVSNIPPATYRSLEHAINRFLRNPSALVRLLPKQYEFTVDVNIDDLQHVRQIVETLELMKPAHLAYVLRAGLNERLQIIDTVTVNYRRYRRVKELRVGLSVTRDLNEVVLR
ncbi:putative phage tail protein [Alkalicoccobacillus plakortidis]|uniref:YmfQ family protein n=1 Tax=Alkalicoccobacillus plakortidis TaxID=444060 RepID=A0ABT0XDX3_9BACI|nr:putative phage tail protein [Alkalicoccobacillus plakortidis]MCM2674102.1 YmfQ family protein [Alkalicoccobacillus plakortidis]